MEWAKSKPEVLTKQKFDPSPTGTIFGQTQIWKIFANKKKEVVAKSLIKSGVQDTMPEPQKVDPGHHYIYKGKNLPCLFDACRKFIPIICSVDDSILVQTEDLCDTIQSAIKVSCK